MFLCSPPGDLTRQFVLEQATGRIKIIKAAVTLGTPFLTLGTTGLNKISTGSERGLLGLAFHPNYASNGFFYVNYTAAGSGATVVERYTVSANPDLATTTSGLVLISIAQPQSNHNGGCLQFGSDGMLYVGMGDGGNGNDTGTGHATGGNAQSGATLLGKMRDVDLAPPMPAIPTSARATRWTRSGTSACAIPGASASTGSPATCSSATSDRTRSKRSASRRSAPRA